MNNSRTCIVRTLGTRFGLTSIFIVLLFSATPAFAAWAFVQANGTYEAGSDNTIAHTLTSNVTAGTKLQCAVTWATGVTISSVSDGTNTWNVSVATYNWDGGIFDAASYTALNVAAGATTVTVTFSGATTEKGLYCLEHSGIATSSAVDVTKTNNQAAPGTGTDEITSGATTATAQANELVTAIALKRTCATCAISAGTGFTARGTQLIGSFWAIRAEDKNLASAGDAVSTFTADEGGTPTSVIVVTYKEPASSGSRHCLLLGVC